MIVKVAKLFELAGLVMAGSRLVVKDLTDFLRHDVPSYDKVWCFGITAFHAVDQIANGLWVGQPFAVAEIVKNLTLFCPHCKREWPEECKCAGDSSVLRSCPCWHCTKTPADFEPARDREAEKKRDWLKADKLELKNRLGGDYEEFVAAEDEDIHEAAAALRWVIKIDFKDLAELHRLDLLAKMAQNEKVFHNHDILFAVEGFGFPPLEDPLGKPPKTRHQTVSLIMAAKSCINIMRGQ